MGIAAIPEVFDQISALASVGGDREFLDEIAGLFQAAYPTLLGDIREGLATCNLGVVADSARLLKAAANNLSAKTASEAAHHLEITAREGELKTAREASAKLEREVERLTHCLAVIRNPKGIRKH